MSTLIQKLGSNDAGEALYAWRSRDARAGWSGPLHSGSAAELQASGPGEACLLLDGSAVVCTRLTLSTAERRHLHTLAPYELEDSLVGSPESIHVASGPRLGQESVLAYTDKAQLLADIGELESLGFTVRHCVPLPLLLPRQDAGWTLALQDGCVHVHHAPGQAFSLEYALAGAALLRLAETAVLPATIDLYAADAAGLDQLDTLLHKAWPPGQGDAGLVFPVQRQQALLWDLLQDPASASVDLRQGELACPLPWQRWWLQARRAVLLTGLALGLHVGLQWLQIMQLDARYQTLVQQSTAAYREVVPQGALVDAEQQLRSQLAQFDTGNAGSVLLLLEVLAPELASHEGMAITRLQWQGQRRELQLSLMARSNSDILGLAEALQAQGLEAQARNLSRQGQMQVANLVVGGLSQ